MFAEMAARTVASPASAGVERDRRDLVAGHPEPHLVVASRLGAGRRSWILTSIGRVPWFGAPEVDAGGGAGRAGERERRLRVERRARARRRRSRARLRRQRPSRRRRPTTGPGGTAACAAPAAGRPRTTVRRSPPPRAASRATSISPEGTGVGAGAERRSCSTRSKSSWSLIASPPALPARPRAARGRCGCASLRFPEAGSADPRSRVCESPE